MYYARHRKTVFSSRGFGANKCFMGFITHTVSTSHYFLRHRTQVDICESQKDTIYMTFDSSHEFFLCVCVVVVAAASVPSHLKLITAATTKSEKKRREEAEFASRNPLRNAPTRTSCDNWNNFCKDDDSSSFCRNYVLESFTIERYKKRDFFDCKNFYIESIHISTVDYIFRGH